MIPIIIVNWNGLSDTIECINSVLSQEYHNYHVYLIDNASDNHEGAQLQSKYGKLNKVTVLLYDQNLGFTGAHLKVWEDFIEDDHSTEYIALLNNDTTIDKSWLSNLYDCTQEKQCGIVASKMIQYWDRSKMDNAGHKILNTGEILPIGHGEPIEGYQKPFKNIGGCGGGVLYSCVMLREIGFFDPHFSTGYEDAELGLRAISTGYKSWYCPNAIVYHKGGQSIKKVFNAEYTAMIQSAILYSYFKNVPLSNLIIAIPSLIFKYLAMLVIDVFFLRWQYLKLIFSSWLTVFQQRHLIVQKRRNLNRKRLKNISNHLDFFLWFDIKRFWNLIIKKNISALDQYGTNAQN